MFLLIVFLLFVCRRLLLFSRSLRFVPRLLLVGRRWANRGFVPLRLRRWTICFRTRRLLIRPWLRLFGNVARLSSRWTVVLSWCLCIWTLVPDRLIGWTVVRRLPILRRIGTRVRGRIIRGLVSRAICRRLIAGPVPHRTRPFVRRWIVRAWIAYARIIHPRIVRPISRRIRWARDGLGYRRCRRAFGRLSDLRAGNRSVRGSRRFHLPHLLSGNRLSWIRCQRLLPRRERNWSRRRSRTGNNRAPRDCGRGRFDAIGSVETRA